MALRRLCLLQPTALHVQPVVDLLRAAGRLERRLLHNSMRSYRCPSPQDAIEQTRPDPKGRLLRMRSPRASRKGRTVRTESVHGVKLTSPAPTRRDAITIMHTHTRTVHFGA